MEWSTHELLSSQKSVGDELSGSEGNGGSGVRLRKWRFVKTSRAKRKKEEGEGGEEVDQHRLEWRFDGGNVLVGDVLRSRTEGVGGHTTRARWRRCTGPVG